MTKITELIELFQSPRFKLTLNENIVVLHRIGELCPPHQQTKIYCLEEILQKIEKGLRDNIDEDPMLGTLSLSLKTFTRYKSADTWVAIKDLILMDCWDAEHDELFHAVQGFAGLEQYLPDDWQQDLLRAVMQKFEDQILLHIQQRKYDFKALKTISRIFIESDRGLGEDLCEEIDFQLNKILKKTSPDSNCAIAANDLIDMGYIFARAKHSAVEFLEFTLKLVMHLVLQGIKETDKAFILNGQELGRFLHSWNFSMQMVQLNDLFESKEVGKLFRSWAHQNILRDNMKYLLKDLIYIHQTLDLIEDDKESEEFVMNFLQRKLLEISLEENSIFLHDIREYMETRVEKEFQGEFKQLADDVYDFLDRACEKNIDRFPARSVFEFVNMLEAHEILEKFPRFLISLPMYVSDNASKFEFDEICYFYLVLTLNSDAISEGESFKNNSGKFWRDMNIVRELIKTVSQGRGFKIDLNSNFHKLLNVIDMTEFFQGGDMV